MNKEEKSAMRRQILAWRLEGQSTDDIAEALSTHHPQLTARAIGRLSDRVDAEILECANEDPDQTRGFVIAAHKELYRRMIAIGDLSGAAKTLQDMYALTRKDPNWVNQMENEDDGTPA